MSRGCKEQHRQIEVRFFPPRYYLLFISLGITANLFVFLFSLFVTALSIHKIIMCEFKTSEQMSLMMGDIPRLLDLIWSWISPSGGDEDIFR